MDEADNKIGNSQKATTSRLTSEEDFEDSEVIDTTSPIDDDDYDGTYGSDSDEDYDNCEDRKFCFKESTSDNPLSKNRPYKQLLDKNNNNNDLKLGESFSNNQSGFVHSGSFGNFNDNNNNNNICTQTKVCGQTSSVGSKQIGTTTTSSNTTRLINRKKRSHRRRFINNQHLNDNDHDGDIDRSNDDFDLDECDENSGNDNELNCNNSDDKNIDNNNNNNNSICSSGSCDGTTSKLNQQQQHYQLQQQQLDNKPTFFLRSRVHAQIRNSSKSEIATRGYNNDNQILDQSLRDYEQEESELSNEEEGEVDEENNGIVIGNNQAKSYYKTSNIVDKYSKYNNIAIHRKQNNIHSSNQILYEQISNDRQTKMPQKQQQQAIGNTSNRYQTLQGIDDYRPSRKISTRSNKSSNHYRSLGGTSGYSRLSHNQYGVKPRAKQTFCQEFKRLLLLVIIVSICCVILWQLYKVLTAEYNWLGFVNSSSKLGNYKHYAVSTDAKPCAKVGSNLLAKGGSAVDAAVGTLICMGVVLPNSLGIGGGSLMTIYDAKQKKTIVIDGREIAPDYASENMFENDTLAASRGPLSVGIPGELAASFKAHQMFGKLNWSELFDESINMAENGAPMVEHLSFALRAKSHAQYIKPELGKIFTNPETNEYYSEGDILVQKELANTLKRIRDNGADEFYKGLTGKLFVEDLQKQGGKITIENLMKYEALVKEPLKFNLENDLTLFTTPMPGSGIVLSVILRIMKEFGYYKNLKPQLTFNNSALYYHRFIEALKFAYAQRAGLEDMPDDPIRMQELISKLTSDEFILDAVSKIDNNSTHNDNRYGGNEFFFKEDHGTAHVSVVDNDGNAVAITSSINLYFGSGLVSPQTGITYNDVMDDFVSPNIVNKFGLAPSKFNHIKPGRRPLSSMAPSIFTDSFGNVKLVIGASGGTKITSSIASVSLRNCFLDEDIKTAIDGPRLHHQYLPNQIYYELNFPKEILQSLVERGHKIVPILDRSSIIMGVAIDNKIDLINGTITRFITANSDYRKGGTVEGL